MKYVPEEVRSVTKLIEPLAELSIECALTCDEPRLPVCHTCHVRRGVKCEGGKVALRSSGGSIEVHHRYS